MRRTLIIIQEDNKLRDEFEQVVKSESDMSCIGSYASISDAMPCIEADRPNIILLNIKAPGISGIACLNFDEPSSSTIRSFLATFCGNACLAEDLASSVNRLVAKPGVQDQIMPSAPASDGGSAPAAVSTVRALVRCSNGDTQSKATKSLSRREQQVLDLLATGLIYRKIATKLGIGEETVRCYVKQIRRKLKVCNRMEAIANYWQTSNTMNPDNAAKKRPDAKLSRV
jgi:DNA-binding NarL/FixJ family response regulator